MDIVHYSRNRGNKLSTMEKDVFEKLIKEKKLFNFICDNCENEMIYNLYVDINGNIIAVCTKCGNIIKL
jgi:predicted RNA-binding Zn-ribbon protein involved in translation (DUF1610 family)